MKDMPVKRFFLICALIVLGNSLKAQTCNTLGQNPSTAFPVCGTNSFSQSTVPYCGGRTIPGKCPAIEGLADTNPFWYKFTCFSPGTLGFVITPLDLGDDYDWQLFDITGRNPNDVYTDPSLFVACNWSGNTGLTGASNAGTSLINCAGSSYPTFSSMPSLQLNHNYILLVSHFTRFTPSQLGYDLEFKGGTANITDPKLPELQSVSASCDATQIVVTLNKRMKCNSLAADGSDFILSPAVGNIVSASGYNCNNSFDMDSLVLTLDRPLTPGNYSIALKNGTDGNTLVDNCDRNIPVGSALSLTILPLQPTPMDSLTTVQCAPQSLDLVFKKNMLCNSVAADGSDFIITGPSTVTISGVSVNCINGGTTTIRINLISPLVVGGNYQVRLQAGTDGNTVYDECAQETPAGSSLNFIIKDTVSAEFQYTINYGCSVDAVHLTHDGRNEISTWQWDLDDAGISTQQNPVANFTEFGSKQIGLIVSNGFCSDSLLKTIELNNLLIAAFETNPTICPEDSAVFINKSIGSIVASHWNFGNGITSNEINPPSQKFPIISMEKIYTITLQVTDANGCTKRADSTIKVLKSCYIDVPTAFTPNGDGLNDELFPLNAFKADNMNFKVYNRTGQMVYSSTEWTEKWDGAIKGEPQDAGIYVWTLDYTHHDTGKHFFLKGSTILIR